MISTSSGWPWWASRDLRCNARQMMHKHVQTCGVEQSTLVEQRKDESYENKPSSNCRTVDCSGQSVSRLILIKYCRKHTSFGSMEGASHHRYLSLPERAMLRCGSCSGRGGVAHHRSQPASDSRHYARQMRGSLPGSLGLDTAGSTIQCSCSCGALIGL